ncbi:hypothetical protein D3C71_655620 [compost metagenome]
MEEIYLSDYDQIEKKNSQSFTEEELLSIRKDIVMNSLNYFEGNAEYIRSQLSKRNNLESKTDKVQGQGNLIIQDRDSEKIENFEIVIPSKTKKTKSRPWLGNQNNELSLQEKKKLGNNVEIVVKEYLEKHPSLYSNIEHISKTDESAHYDIKYFDLVKKTVKYIECKYFNGYSFSISRDEKDFAEDNIEQYEIWLVNQYKQIYCISDFNELGELEPNNYQVYIKITDYEIQN